MTSPRRVVRADFSRSPRPRFLSRYLAPPSPRSLVRVVGSRARSAAGSDCTTRRLNAHRTTERRLLYPWHPWSGLSVHVHEVTERGRGTALRCSLDGDAGRCLEVPAWMFEPEACVPLRLASQPQVGVGALSALRRLLAEVSGRRSMDASALPAEGDFPDQNRGKVHATPPRPLPGDTGEPSSAIRSVRPASGSKRLGRDGLAGGVSGIPCASGRLNDTVRPGLW